MRHHRPNSSRQPTPAAPSPRWARMMLPLALATVFEIFHLVGHYTLRTLDALMLRLRGQVATRQRRAEQYFPLIDPGLPNERGVQKIERAIAERGSWSESVEWRISTVMTSKI